MSLQGYYDACKAGGFQAADPAECGCGGRGYFLSDLDIWFRCSIHATPGQRHPEDDSDDFTPIEGPMEGPVLGDVAPPKADDDMPF